MPQEEDHRPALDRIAEKLDFLRQAWEREPDRFESDIAVGPPLTEAEIRQVEIQHHITFPGEYRAFRLRFGDTATGPGKAFFHLRDGLKANSNKRFPLSNPLLGECDPVRQRLTTDQRRVDDLRLGREWDAVPKDFGVIELSGYGCAIDAFLIINGPYSGRVWIQQGDTSYYGPYGGFEPFDDEGVSADWEPVYPARDYTFFEWYDHWLDAQLKQVR